MADGYKNGKPDVPYWLGEVRKGLQFRKEKALEAKWPRWRQYYRGDWGGKILPSNIFFKMLRTTVPRIYFRNPSVSIISTKPGMEGAVLAKILQRVDNKMIHQMRLKKHMKRIVQDAWMFGTGLGKKGFGAEFSATPVSFGETRSPIVNRGKDRVEYNYDVMPNMPWFMRAGTGSFVVPADTMYSEEKRWSCFIIRRPVEDVKADPRFKNTEKLHITGHSFSTEVGGKVDVLNSVRTTDLYEIRDKKTGKVFVISPTMLEKALLFDDDEFASLGIEVENSLVFNDDDESFWGIPDSQILEPLQLELNEIRTNFMYHRRLSLVKLLAKRNAITPEQVQNLLSGDVMAVAWVTGELSAAVKEITMGGIPDGLVQSEISVLQDVRETVGFGRNEFGEYKPGSKSPSATEAQIVKMASDIRVDERRDMVADMLVDIISGLNPILFAHWTGEQVEQIMGPAGVPFWVHFRPEMMQKINYEINVDPDQSLPQTKDLREQKAVQLYTVLKENPLIDPLKLTTHLLHEMHGVAFDDMIRGVPPGLGMSAQAPMSVGQFGQVAQNAQNMPQLTGPGTVQ